jgi:predicted nucleotidyltransferase
MRLSQKHIDLIIKSAQESFGFDIKLFLFGSRVDDTKRGGDIDLLIESSNEIKFETQIKFLNHIYRFITERRIDLLIYDSKSKNSSIYEDAKKNRILLC